MFMIYNRKMDQYFPTGKDIDHYKLLSIHKQPLDNRQKYLDVLCFPLLFPTGRYEEFHPRAVKLSFSEYLKSKLINCDSRFHKNPEFVFYYMWQELSSGIYNVLNSTSRRYQTVKQFVDGINGLQSVRGTKQFWYRQKGVIREFGCPTLFLTFSCAEYESVEIGRYLRKVNEVAPSYPMQRLCTFLCPKSLLKKFRDFFSTVLVDKYLEKLHIISGKKSTNPGVLHIIT